MQSVTAKASLEFPSQHDDRSIVDNTELPTRARLGSCVLPTIENNKKTDTIFNLEIQSVTAKESIQFPWPA